MYDKLPSEILVQATTFDLMVADVYLAWEKQKLNPSDSSQYQTEDLQKIFNSVRK